LWVRGKVEGLTVEKAAARFGGRGVLEAHLAVLLHARLEKVYLR